MNDVTKGVLIIAVAVAVFSVAGFGLGGYLSGVGFNIQSAASSTAPAATATSAKGESVYNTSCAGCHGAAGAGSVGPKLAGLVGSWDDATFKNAIVAGKGGDGRELTAVMPRFTPEQISDDDLKELHNYLKSL